MKSVCQINVSNSTFSYFFEERGFFFFQIELHANISYQGIFCNIFFFVEKVAGRISEILVSMQLLFYLNSGPLTSRV